jgi:peroxiredoxin
MIRQALIIIITAFSGVQLFAQTLPQKKLNDTLYLISGIESAKQSAEKKALYAKQTSAIEASGIPYSCLKQKSKAPDFTVKNAKGKVINLLSELEGGPVILIWYQGGWNTYCNVTLRYFQAYFAEFKKYGATIIAFTPEIPEKIAITKTKNKISYELLHDKDNLIAKKYGISFTLLDTVNTDFETRFQLSKFNGNTKGELPLAATYLINTNGKIIYAFIDSDYRKRGEPVDMLRALKGMGYPARK